MSAAPEPGFWAMLAAAASGLFATAVSFVLMDYRGRVQKVEEKTDLLTLQVTVLATRTEAIAKGQDQMHAVMLSKVGELNNKLDILVGEVKAP